ncbi:MAG: endopeptidase La [Spirochaetaceae bacterium]|nr:MAG: endopeptidase La [Spirochaetaceae bacterium]
MKLFEKPSRKDAGGPLPLVPLKDLVVFPHMVVPFFVGRKGSVMAIEEAMAGERRVFLGCQKNTALDPSDAEIHSIGTIAHILQMMKMPDGTVRLLVEGETRAHITSFVHRKYPFRVESRPLEPVPTNVEATISLVRTAQSSFSRYASLNKKIAPETVTQVEALTEPDKLVDTICAHVPLTIEKKFELLAERDAKTRVEEIAIALEAENEVLEMKKQITARVRKRMEKSQREYFLNEQLREINKELGKDEDDASGVKELEEKLATKTLPDVVKTRAQKELNRLKKLQPISPEAGIVRTYIDWIVELPWDERSSDKISIADAARILDEDHYDMEKPKERMIEYIAVRRLNPDAKGPILCFVGPPGTGKTSLGKSLARALGREFVRISLGGVRDEAEIRGHRRTYVGALPGKIIQSLKRAGTRNPVFLLDEVDKMSTDFRGDPASALLEVLDPEQNWAFVDHYLETPFDLSEVVFVTTANSLHNIPHALRDRMEVIEIPGYTEYEKLRIAEGFIIPKQIEANGLGWADVKFRRDGLSQIIEGYTMESGVRNLERQIATVIRKIAREAVEKGYSAPTPQPVDSPDPDAPAPTADAPAPPERAFRRVITAKTAERYLGKKSHRRELLYPESRTGLANGLAWTENGGTVLPVEASVFDGTGELILTGSLGDVMKESARTAYSFIRAHSHRFHLSQTFYQGRDLHIHVPEGAIPKDGPSAGITLVAALLSTLAGIRVQEGFAMTGEITLTGRVLPVGGIKEKILAAHRKKIQAVLLPKANTPDVEELPAEITAEIRFEFADNVLDALAILFPADLFENRPY